MIAIVDYGMGNLRSVQKAFERVGFEATVTANARDLKNARGIVLPGVGAFGKAMGNLREQGLVDVLHHEIESGKPFLGICLGLQLLLEESEERFSPEEPYPEGLGIFRGRVRRFAGDLKVPQIGWNQVRQSRPTPLYDGIVQGEYAYFVHSYYADPEDPGVVATTTDYGVEFASSLVREHIMAVQFHPEKSSRVGLSLLKNFGKAAAA